MFGTGLSYLLKYPVGAATAVMADPIEAWLTLQDKHAQSREEKVSADLYVAESDWEHRVHDLLHNSWPCAVISEFWNLWPEVLGDLREKGISVGPESFKYWNDGDAGLVRAIWCLVRHLRPSKVVETGVAHGITSRFILEALERNKFGHLWSIDKPPVERELHKHIGIAIDNRCRHRWTYLSGSSRRRLPGLLSKLGQIDLFVHDSLHSERNVRFESDLAWTRLRPGGVIVIDDIDANRGFHTFTRANLGQSSIICEAEPIRPDLRRFNKKGLFGVVVKPTETMAQVR
jgi:hypothetical protein